jgi:integrase
MNIYRKLFPDFFLTTKRSMKPEIGKAYYRSTVSLIKDVVSGVFSYAVDEGMLTSNPRLGITKRLNFSREKGKADIEPLTAKELALYLNTCQKYYPEFYPFFLCLARTGMRLGEAIAVAIQDIDFNSKYIWVKKSYRRGKFNPPKNGKARKVDMSDQLTDVLKGLMTTRKKDALKSGMGASYPICCLPRAGM